MSLFRGLLINGVSWKLTLFDGAKSINLHYVIHLQLLKMSCFRKSFAFLLKNDIYIYLSTSQYFRKATR